MPPLCPAELFGILSRYREMEQNATPPKNIPLTTKSKLRRVIYTLNNYTEHDVEQFKSLDHVRAQIIGKEVGESGTPHLQGAILFDRPILFNKLKKLFPRAHFERMLGTPEQAFRYCQKDGDYWSCGELPTPGKRNDLSQTVSRIQNGATLSQLANDPYSAIHVVKYHRGITTLINLINNSKPLRNKTNVWIHGPSGS